MIELEAYIYTRIEQWHSLKISALSDVGGFQMSIDRKLNKIILSKYASVDFCNQCIYL